MIDLVLFLSYIGFGFITAILIAGAMFKSAGHRDPIDRMLLSGIAIAFGIIWPIFVVGWIVMSIAEFMAGDQ